MQVLLHMWPYFNAQFSANLKMKAEFIRCTCLSEESQAQISIRLNVEYQKQDIWGETRTRQMNTRLIMTHNGANFPYMFSLRVSFKNWHYENLNQPKFGSARDIGNWLPRARRLGNSLVFSPARRLTTWIHIRPSMAVGQEHKQGSNVLKKPRPHWIKKCRMLA